MSVSLIQGASRGLGLQFCKTLLAAQPSGVVIATCRSPESANELRELEKTHRERLVIEQLDVCKDGHFEKVCENVDRKFGKLDLLINAAGILHPSGKGETSLKDVDREGLLATIQTNTVGPMLTGKYFSGLLQKGDGLIGQQGTSNPHRGVLVNISARVGSITDNALGGWYSYRMSKAALNMATKTLSLELGRGRNKVICVSLHPGTVDTDLSRRYHKTVPKDKLFSAEHSVSCLLEVINSLSLENTGKFMDFAGIEIPF